jgi:Usg-like family
MTSSGRPECTTCSSRGSSGCLQSYIWQDYDLAPKFPKLVDFLDFLATNPIGCASSIGGWSRRKSPDSSRVS